MQPRIPTACKGGEMEGRGTWYGMEVTGEADAAQDAHSQQKGVCGAGWPQAAAQ